MLKRKRVNHQTQTIKTITREDPLEMVMEEVERRITPIVGITIQREVKTRKVVKEKVKEKIKVKVKVKAGAKAPRARMVKVKGNQGLPKGSTLTRSATIVARRAI